MNILDKIIVWIFVLNIIVFMLAITIESRLIMAISMFVGVFVAIVYLILEAHLQD